MAIQFHTFIKPYLSSIDNGNFYRIPFKWLYTLLAILNLVIPFYVAYKLIDNNIFDSDNKFIAAFIFIWLIVTFASWIGFQIWWDRKNKVDLIYSKSDEFVVTPVLSNLIQSIGEWLGTWIGIVGLGISLVLIIFLGNDAGYLFSFLGIPFIEWNGALVLLFPLYGFLVIFSTRFLSEQFRVLASIANNVKKYGQVVIQDTSKDVEIIESPTENLNELEEGVNGIKSE